MAVEDIPVLLSIDRDARSLVLRIDESGWQGLPLPLPVLSVKCEGVEEIDLVADRLIGWVGFECEVEQRPIGEGRIEVQVFTDFHVEAHVIICTGTSCSRGTHTDEDLRRKASWLFGRYSETRQQYETVYADLHQYQTRVQSALEGLLARAKTKWTHYEQKGKGATYKGEVTAYEKALALIRERHK